MRRAWEVMLMILSVALPAFVSETLPHASIQRTSAAVTVVACLALIGIIYYESKHADTHNKPSDLLARRVARIFDVVVPASHKDIATRFQLVAPHLDVRHSQEPPYRIVEPPESVARYVWHHIGIANPLGSPVADNVRVELKNVEPRPRFAAFAGAFPYGIPVKDSPEPWAGSVVRINPGAEVLFLIGQSWRKEGDETPVVAGIDGRDKWERPSVRATLIEREERLRLDYEATSATHQPLDFSVELRVGDRDLITCELVKP